MGTTMKNFLTRALSTALAIALLGASPAAIAKAQTPVRVGNIWGWHDHQPSEMQVQQQEKAAGIAPTPSQQASDTATLNQIYRQLLH